MADCKLMYIPNDDTQSFPTVDYNLWLKHFWTLNLMKQPFKIKQNSPKLLIQRIRKDYLKLWELV